MNERLHVLGIRHHGPGSASSVLRTLDQVSPEIVLIEGPPEGAEILRFVREGLVPPVAMLVHVKDQPAVASFFPFAGYSPEWVAADWALRHDRPVRFIDLPCAVRLRDATRTEPEADDTATGADPDEATPDPDDVALLLDPLAHLARLEGYEDSEAWWNRLIEESPGDPEIFRHIEAAMAALREAMPPQDTPHARRESQREATMRQHVRAALREIEGDVAVVVGAWHAPFVRPDALSATHDRKVLAGLQKARVVATWIPWTDSRLASTSGYGAGVRHPAWYDTLWRTRHQRQAVVPAATRFQVRVAHVLRRHGHMAPPSSVIDAVRLTEALAAVRHLPRPGLTELRDAAVATLCEGDARRWGVVEEALLVGDRIGVVPETVPQMPLAADLARQQKALRLKPTGLDSEIKLDLRSRAGGAKSVLLHRLVQLEVPWGRLVDSGGSRGTFRERWILRWEPEHAVALAEALRWGTTIAGAAGGRAMHDMDQSHSPADVARLVRTSLLAQLEEAAQHGVARLQALTATAGDVAALAGAVPPLVDTLRYGTARELPTVGLADLIEGLVDRTLLGLTYAVRDLEREAAEALRTTLGALDQSLARHADGRRHGDWLHALGRVAHDDQAAPLLMGFATRRLSDTDTWSTEQVGAALAASLSPGFPLARAAAWLEGFLGDAGLVLLHDSQLYHLVDQWLMQLTADDLLEALPIFRRATCGFSDHQRAQLIARARGEIVAGTVVDLQETTPAFEAGAPLLATMLGLESP